MILDRGCQHDMEKLNIICSLCEWNGIFKHYQVFFIKFFYDLILDFFLSKEHLDKNHLNPFCEQCGQEFDSVDSFTQHSLVCEMILVDCVLKPYGCREQVY